MAAEQQEVIADVANAADDNAEILKKINRVLRTLSGGVAELLELVEELGGAPGKRAKERDANGEPTWNYLVKRPVPEDIYLTKKFLEYGAEYGFDANSMAILMHGKGTYEGFIKYYKRTGAKWPHWSLVFQKWVRKERERKDKAQTSRDSTRFDRSRTRG